MGVGGGDVCGGGVGWWGGVGWGWVGWGVGGGGKQWWAVRGQEVPPPGCPGQGTLQARDSHKGTRRRGRRLFSSQAAPQSQRSSTGRGPTSPAATHPKPATPTGGAQPPSLTTRPAQGGGAARTGCAGCTCPRLQGHRRTEASSWCVWLGCRWRRLVAEVAEGGVQRRRGDVPVALALKCRDAGGSGVQQRLLAAWRLQPRQLCMRPPTHHPAR